MKLHAYVLAAEPAWIEASVRSYYPIVDRIVVSYDAEGRGWTGAPIPVAECLERLGAIDPDGKLEFRPGHFARADHPPIVNDTDQRRVAMADAARGADWVLAIDTDEVLPDAFGFARRLRDEVPAGFGAVDWPMRSFFRQTGVGRFLEVCSPLRRQLSEYPGCVAVRPGTPLTMARQVDIPRWRFDIRKLGFDRVERWAYEVHGVIPKAEAILHFSWARTEADLVTKLANWGHNIDFDWQAYYENVWLPSPGRWPLTCNFHPIWPRRWPALRPVRLPLYAGPGGG